MECGILVRIIKRTLIGLCALVIIAGISGYLLLSGSMPQYQGKLTNKGFSAETIVQRDSIGTAIITGENRIDISHALGFVHGQERFFQMDLLRRSGAGELAELFGEELLEIDKERRIHQFRLRAGEIVDNLSPMEKANLDAYVTGVNQGLVALSVKPVEYLLLGTEPIQWRSEDSILVAFAMYFELQDSSGKVDMSRGTMKRLLPDSVYAYLTNHKSPWQSLLVENEHKYAEFPAQKEFAYIQSSITTSKKIYLPERKLGGSNQWAVQTHKDGKKKAIIANDMHLGLGVPNLWFRAALNYKHDSKLVNVNGVTLPGLPLMVIGSNTKIAWTFTNSQTNLDDVFTIEEFGDYYLTNRGKSKYIKEVEIINVKDSKAEHFTIRKTPYGPVLPEKYFDKSVILRWLAHHRKSVNLNLLTMELSGDVNQAIANSRLVKMPTMNFMVADHLGNIGWTLIGPLSKQRNGYSGQVPIALTRIPDGPSMDLLDAKDYPTIINPRSGILWTANNQTTNGVWGEILGDGAYVNGSRAQQIHKRLLSLEKPAVQDMLDIQLDDEAMFLARWHQLLLNLIERSPAGTVPAELSDRLRHWQGHAEVNSVAYYVVREFRLAARVDILEKLFQQCTLGWNKFDMVSFDYEEPSWDIINHQVTNFLDSNVENWDQQLLIYLNRVIAPYRKADGKLRLEEMKWGEHNKAAIRHPLSEALPFFSRWLDAPADALAGDYNMPRIARPSMGASERMAVMPGDEKHAIFHMPGGQSGHVLSPFYIKGHADWVKGVPTKLLPGAPIYQLSLH